jgi:hypothetical protein
MASLQLCRSCDKAPRLRGSLYCEPCKRDMDSFTGAAQRRKHTPDGCWCVDCTTGELRAFRQRQADIRHARELALYAKQPLDFDPPDDPGPRCA